MITSEADNANNRFQSGTLTTKEIENHSELKTKSAAISGGSGGINPMSALSLLGNKNESSESTTRSAVGENINLTLTDDPNAETTLKTLNRDTKNANEKVTKHDINKVKETEEIVKSIGEISDKAMQIYTHSEREKIERAKLELGKAKQQAKERGVPAQQIDDDPQVQWAAKQLADKQKTYDKEYGTGSPTKRAVDAVTAALQGLAEKNTGQAIVGLASPYLNEQIKRHTLNADGSVNTKANLVAHALLGGIEAAVTGNNIAAGAVAGASGEAAAIFITNALYPNKKPSELTEAEKKNVTFLSQLAGGLAAGIVGDSTQAVALGGDIAKRAVENNYLSVQLAKEKADIQQRLKNSNLDKTEKEKLENRLAQINQIDIDKDIALEQACTNAPLSSHCQTLMKEVKNYEFGYFGTSSQSGNYYGMPVYTRNNLLYGEDANKVAAYSKQYDLLRLRKEVSLEEFAKYTGWDINTVRSIYAASDTAQAIAAVYAGAYMTVSGIGKNQSKVADFSKQVPNAVSGKDRQVTVGNVTDYGKPKADLRVSTGAESPLQLEKLKEDYRKQELESNQKLAEKAVKDLSMKPQGSVLMIPDYRQQLAQAKASLPPRLQKEGNSAIANISIEGLNTKTLVGHSRINSPQGDFIGKGKTEFDSLRLPNKDGRVIDRKIDSEYKIFSNLADQLGSNTQAKGQVTIFTERPACQSCLSVAEQFNKRYPNIKVNIFDNNGNPVGTIGGK